MDSSIEELLKITTKSVLPRLKSDCVGMGLSATDILVFFKKDGLYILEETVNLSGEPRDFGNLKIPSEVFAGNPSDDQLIFFDDASKLFSDVNKDDEVYSKKLGRFFYAVYIIFCQNEKVGTFIFVYPKEVQFTDKEKYALSLVAQSNSLKLENQLLIKKNTDIVIQQTDLQKKIESVQRQKDEFVSMAAHELRAPMTAIKGYVSMVIEGDTGDIPEKARGFLADANNINDRLIRLVNNMLNVSRIEEGRMLYQVEDENLSGVVRAVFSQFTPEAQRKGLEYKLEIPTTIYDKVEVDPDRIQEVIGNLISNAVKYTDSGSIIVKLDQPNKGYVRCEVIDTGIGISKEEQSKLFQKFQRVESNVGKTTGTGLGLYICKLLVERFGGEIGIESETGKGSSFWFELPVVS